MLPNNIKFIHGLPYKPHSQGVCEQVHRTKKMGLIVKMLEYGNKFDIVK